MSFASDFSSIAGTLSSTFNTVWTDLNPPHITAPSIPTSTGTSVGSALKQATPTTSTTSTITYILLGSAVVVLVLALVLTGFGKRR